MTPEQVAALSACWKCLPDFRAALLFLLATNAGMTLEQVVAGSSCWKCVPDFQSAELFLLNTIATNAAAAAGQVSCGDVAPTTPPTNSCTIYYDRVTTAFYYWNATTASWVLKV